VPQYAWEVPTPTIRKDAGWNLKALSTSKENWSRCPLGLRANYVLVQNDANAFQNDAQVGSLEVAVVAGTWCNFDTMQGTRVLAYDTTTMMLSGCRRTAARGGESDRTRNEI